MIEKLRMSSHIAVLQWKHTLIRRFLEFLLPPDRLFFLNPANLRMSGWVIDLPFGGLWYGPLYIAVAFLVGWTVIYMKLSVEAVK